MLINVFLDLPAGPQMSLLFSPSFVSFLSIICNFFLSSISFAQLLPPGFLSLSPFYLFCDILPCCLFFLIHIFLQVFNCSFSFLIFLLDLFSFLFQLFLKFPQIFLFQLKVFVNLLSSFSSKSFLADSSSLISSLKSFFPVCVFMLFQSLYALLTVFPLYCNLPPLQTMSFVLPLFVYTSEIFIQILHSVCFPASKSFFSVSDFLFFLRTFPLLFQVFLVLSSCSRSDGLHFSEEVYFCLSQGC